MNTPRARLFLFPPALAVLLLLSVSTAPPFPRFRRRNRGKRENCWVFDRTVFFSFSFFLVCFCFWRRIGDFLVDGFFFFCVSEYIVNQYDWFEKKSLKSIYSENSWKLIFYFKNQVIPLVNIHGTIELSKVLVPLFIKIFATLKGKMQRCIAARMQKVLMNTRSLTLCARDNKAQKRSMRRASIYIDEWLSRSLWDSL